MTYLGALNIVTFIIEARGEFIIDVGHEPLKGEQYAILRFDRGVFSVEQRISRFFQPSILQRGQPQIASFGQINTHPQTLNYNHKDDSVGRQFAQIPLILCLSEHFSIFRRV